MSYVIVMVSMFWEMNRVYWKVWEFYVPILHLSTGFWQILSLEEFRQNGLYLITPNLVSKINWSQRWTIVSSSILFEISNSSEGASEEVKFVCWPIESLINQLKTLLQYHRLQIRLWCAKRIYFVILVVKSVFFIPFQQKETFISVLVSSLYGIT